MEVWQAPRCAAAGAVDTDWMTGQEGLHDAVAKAKRENPGLGVKKLVALVKNSSPDLAKVGAKEVRQVLAELASGLDTATSEPKQSIEPDIEPQPAPEAATAPEEVKENVDTAEQPAGVAVPPPVASTQLPPRPRSALKARGTNGNAPGSSGKAAGIRFAEQLLDVRDIEAVGNCTPTPPRTRPAAMRRQQSAGQTLMQDPEIMQLMSQPGVMAGVQEIMNDPQTGLVKYQHTPMVMVTFMKIQEKMKLLQKMEAAPSNSVEDEGDLDPEEAPGATEEEAEVSDASLNAQAVAVLLKRGRMALVRGDVDKARGALKAGLQLDIMNADLKVLMQDIKSQSSQ
eukprot:COSAG02_NODE_9173_length_2303_cov_0.982305_1_plen_341_part_00